MKITNKILVACLPGIVAGALFAASTGDRTIGKPDASAMTKAKNALAKLPLSFEPNRGQTDPRVQFLSRGPGYTVFFTKDETVLSLKDTKTSNAVVRMRFLGGTNSASAHPSDALQNTTNYLIGNDSSKWLTGLAQYSKLRYENVYPGVDVVYQGGAQRLRYDFIVKPGASASAIQMAFEGADKVALTANGDLALTIGGKTLVTSKPYTYQEEAGAKKEIASHFVVKNGRVAFELAKYDTTKDLVIDPSVSFETYLGGILNDAVNGVAIVNPTLTISSSPSAYFVTGTTVSPNFPTTAGVLPTCGSSPAPGCDPAGLTGATLSGSQSVFVTKISFNGQVINWSTYLGGNSRDNGAAIAVDIAAAGCAAGCPVVVGQTFSANFPTYPLQTTSGSSNGIPGLQGTNDAFAAKLNTTGTALIYSVYLGGIADDQATGVAIAEVPTAAGITAGDVFVGGYTDSPFFINTPNGGVAANHNQGTNSSDAFVVKIPASFTGASPTVTSLVANLYGGFGEEFARAIAYNPTNNMVYLGGDTTTASQNFIAPNNVNLPGITNNTVNQYTVANVGGGNVATGLPGPGPNARGGFIAAFDAATLVRTFATYVAVSPATAPNNTGIESIFGIAAEGGAAATSCSIISATCAATSVGTATISATSGNIGHIYITGDTTSHVPSSGIAAVVPQFACANPLAASSLTGGGPITGPDGLPIVIPGGNTIPAGCVTDLITQAPFNTNQAVTTGCQFPLPLNLPTASPTATCNIAAFVAILDGALLTAPSGIAANPVGNQIEYWAYYSSANGSTVANALAIDTNPTTLSSVYSLGTYQQMYITGSTTQTSNSGAACLTGGAAPYIQTVNCLPVTNITANPANSTFLNPSEIFTSYNVGTTTGGGVGGYDPYPSGYNNPCGTPQTVACEVDAYVARFNANALAASTYGGQGSAASANPNLMGYGCPAGTVFGALCTGGTPNDHSFLIHTPQFNFGEFMYATIAQDGTSTPNSVGNAIAVDPTRAVIIGGATNVANSPVNKGCNVIPSVCNFATTNSLQGTEAGGTDGWISVLFFNDILTNAASQPTANPWLQPVISQQVLQGANGSYIETTPAPYGPTFDFAISDPATQTQTFQVVFTGQAAGQLLGTAPWYIPVDARSGANPPVFDNNLPGSGIAYYVPCQNPATVPTTFTFNPAGAASQGYYNNAYPAPGTPYGPMTCAFPTNHLYEGLPELFSGYPGLTAAQSNGTLTTPGWLVLSQDINPGVVRMTLDRRAAAGLLEGVYIAQFLVTTLDSQAATGGQAHPPQWPPCGPVSALNPYTIPGPVAATPAPGIPCPVASTPLPADNVSVLVTVRLVVRPALFLSRNAGILTGITSPLTVDPLYGPSATLTVQDGTSRVPNWLYTGTANDTAIFPPLTTLYEGIGGVPGLLNVNAGAVICVPGNVASLQFPTLNPLTGTAWPAGSFPATVAIPCPVTATAPAPYTGAITAATAYYGNGPGDVPTNVTYTGAIPTSPSPIISYLYDIGTVQSPNIAQQEGLAITRPDQAASAGTAFNSDFQGGVDPLSQRNDATVHKYYTTAEGAATLSVAAINCTNWNTQNGILNHVNAVGNWLAVQINNAAPNSATTANYTPICTDLTAATIGTQKAPATFCKTGCTYTSGTGIGDDTSMELTSYPLSALVNGQQIALDFLSKAFSDRTAMNGIPTGTYTAQVFVWSTRAKNVVPGYCLGSSMPISPGGVDPTPNPCTPSTSAIGSSSNPNPFVPVQNVQTFTVSLFVFDTTQVIQITPNSCQSTSQPSVTLSAGVENSENDNTGNPISPFGFGSAPAYSNFGPNADSLVQYSLLPFQTTGQNITGCFLPNQVCNQTVNGAGSNQPVLLPAGVAVNAQTLAQYNACALPTGTFNGQSIVNGLTVNGAFVPGIGSLTQTGNITLLGPSSQATFIPAGNGTNGQWTLYVCRPTVAPAWLNSPLYPGNILTITTPQGGTGLTNGTPEPYANGNGPFGGTVGGPVTGCSVANDPLMTGVTLANCQKGQAPVPTINGLTCPLANTGGGTGIPPVLPTTALGIFRPGASGTGASLLEDTSRINSTLGTFTFVSNFFAGSTVSPAVGDIAVAGDWTGVGHAHVGVYRPSTGQWFLDTTGDGLYDAGDSTYNFGGLAGDIPVVGDWAQTGKSCIGIFRQGFSWLLDLNCNGTFDNTPTDAFFPFGGIAGDVPVVGAWTGAGTRVGVVRKYAPGGVPQGVPFFWVMDSGAATAGSAPTSHLPASGAFPFGGLPCTSLFPGCTAINANASPDMFVTGDWNGTGISRAGIYRAGIWIEDVDGTHTGNTGYAFGGITNDQPIPAKW